MSDNKASGKAIQILVELSTRNDIFLSTIMEMLDEAKHNLKVAGEDGSNALAQLITELVESRNGQIHWALEAAKECTPTSELVSAIQVIISAESIKSGRRGRFTPEIFSDGKIGWTSGTFKDAQANAISAIKALTGIEIEAPQVSHAAAIPGSEKWSETQHQIANAIKKWAEYENELADVDELLSSTTSEEAAPVLLELLKSDLNGELSRAVVQSFAEQGYSKFKLAPEYGIPIIAVAINSSHAGTRNLSISYLFRYPTSEAKEIVLRRLQIETHPELRPQLQRFTELH